MIYELYARLSELASSEFSDIAATVEIIRTPGGRARKLRIRLIDRTFVDVWYSADEVEYSFHWEQRMIRPRVHRHDNAPHKRWRYVETFPKHFHNGAEREH